MRTRAVLAVLFAITLPALAGCTPSAAISESGYVLLVAPGPSESHLLAQLDGELSISGECYSLQGSGSNYPVVFPAGTRISSGDQLDIPGVGAVDLGDQLRGSGGEVPVEISPVEIPIGCPTDTVIIYEAP